MTDLHAEFFSVKSDVQRRFRALICNQLFKHARAFLNYERRQLKSREQLNFTNSIEIVILDMEIVTLDCSLVTLILFLFIQIDSAPNPQVTLKSTILIFLTIRILNLGKFLLLILIILILMIVVTIIYGRIIPKIFWIFLKT